MTITYPAVFTPRADGSFEGFFPDLDGCVFKGNDIDEAINDAIAEEKQWIEVQIDEDDDMPFVSHHEDIPLEEGQFIRDIGVIIHVEVGYY